MSDSSVFFDVLWRPGPGYGEIRAIKDGEVKQVWLTLGTSRGRQAVTEAGLLEEDGYDVYFGVLPRLIRNGRADTCVSETDICWADIDAKHFSSNRQEGKRRALESLSKLNMAPQILVDSGGGYHAYWFLNRPIPRGESEAIMRGISKDIGGDYVHDAARVLRVPGTRNYKYPATVARIIRFELSRVYRPSDFDSLIPIERVLSRDPSPIASYQPLPEWMVELLAEEVPKGSRSEHAFKIVLWLLRYGRTDEEIEGLAVAYPEGFGAKYLEKGSDGPRWLQATINAARKRA